MVSRLRTQLTDYLGIQIPIVLPPLAGGASGADLVAAVTQGGGYGFIPAGHGTFATLQEELGRVRTLLSQPTGSIPIGIGFLCFRLEELSSDVAKDWIKLAVENVDAIWLSFGVKVADWIQAVREVGRELKKNVKVFVLVNDVDEAKRLVQNGGVDVLVIQGLESGGHGRPSLPLLSLFPSITSSLSTISSPPLYIAAGGISTGSQLAAVLALGASGAAIGTRFLLTPESSYSSKQKEWLLSAKGEDTVRSFAFDKARDTEGWPEGVDGRGLRGGIIEDELEGVEKDELMRRYKEGVQQGDVKRSVTWSGTSIGLINKIVSAREVLVEIQNEALESINKLVLTSTN